MFPREKPAAMTREGKSDPHYGHVLEFSVMGVEEPGV